MRRIVPATLLALAIAAVLGVSTRPMRRSTDATSDTYYFHRFAFHMRTDADTFVRTWFSTQLRAMGEPSLSYGSSVTGYRFLWLRSFEHPIAIRVLLGLHYPPRIEGIELDGAGGYSPGTLLNRTSYELSLADWEAVQFGFGHVLRTDHGLIRPRDACCDGAQWVFERSVANDYRVAAFWSPSSGAARTLGLRLLELSHMMPESHIY